MKIEIDIQCSPDRTISGSTLVGGIETRFEGWMELLQALDGLIKPDTRDQR